MGDMVHAHPCIYKPCSYETTHGPDSSLKSWVGGHAVLGALARAVTSAIQVLVQGCQRGEQGTELPAHALLGLH